MIFKFDMMCLGWCSVCTSEILGGNNDTVEEESRLDLLLIYYDALCKISVIKAKYYFIFHNKWKWW